MFLAILELKCSTNSKLCEDQKTTCFLKEKHISYITQPPRFKTHPVIHKLRKIPWLPWKPSPCQTAQNLHLRGEVLQFPFAGLFGAREVHKRLATWKSSGEPLTLFGDVPPFLSKLRDNFMGDLPHQLVQNFLANWSLLRSCLSSFNGAPVLGMCFV